MIIILWIGFEMPAVRDELAGQPIEQLRMRRPFAASAEVARRGDDAAAHVKLPEPIDFDAGQQATGAERSTSVIHCATARRR